MTWILLAAFGYLLIVIAIANQLDRKRPKPASRYVLSYPYGVTERVAEDEQAPDNGPRLNGVLSALLLGLVALLLLTSFNALLLGFVPAELLDDVPEINEVSRETALSVWGIGLGAALVCGLVILSGGVRAWFSRRLGTHGDFNPEAAVHKTALVLAITILSYTLMELMLVGGVAGLADNLEQQSPGAVDALANLAVMVLAAFFGAGLIIRRSLPQVIKRLGLRIPSRDDVTWGVGTAFLCLLMIMFFSAMLTLIFSPEILEQQGAASEQIARALGGSLWIAFLAALGAAVGEEILFRGALQPIFGLIPTTLFFGLLHSQYAFTPGSVAILVVGLAFGILKQRQSTTAAIIAHFTYNFVLLGFVFLAIQIEESGLLPEVESIIYFTLSILPFSV